MLTDALSSSKQALRRRAGRLKLYMERHLGEYVPRIYRTVLRIPETHRTRYLIVIAHARSGSSLLVHLLHSNPSIFGIGEHHVSYDSRDDLQRLLDRSRFLARDPRLDPPWVMDKIVWDHHRLADDVLQDPRVRLLFLVREPRTTFPSLGRVLSGCKTPQAQRDYYRRRLQQMIDLAERVGDPQRMSFVDYDELVGDSDRVLAQLSADLDLAEPLQRSYETTAKTGHMGWGDPGDAIRAGKIVKVERPSEPLPPDIEQEAQEIYTRAVQRLRALTHPALAAAPMEAVATTEGVAEGEPVHPA